MFLTQSVCIKQSVTGKSDVVVLTHFRPIFPFYVSENMRKPYLYLSEFFRGYRKEIDLIRVKQGLAGIVKIEFIS